jgi:formate-dependent nitrite reductase membrane component NrfD/ferredoxin
MYQRDDGIVEFDNRACIGCKACMQACPYDAIHIDPSTHTASKCHFCAHRIEVGLEPSCVVVCPTHAIISGDMDDPESEISRVLSKAKVSVRKPEQGTAPKLFYVEGNATTLTPTASSEQSTFMWADILDRIDRKHNGHSKNGAARKNREGTALRAPQPQGEPQAGPIVIPGGNRAEHMVQVGYNAQHRVPWHWPVPAYLVTKGIAAGLFSIVALAWLLGALSFDRATAIATGATATVFMLITTALLVFDLDQPKRFLYILLRPQWRSWLARGAIFLIGFSTLTGLWTAAELGAQMGIVPAELVDGIRPWLLGIGLPLALGVAIYTAFLFGQAEGRDLWQSSLLPIHLVVQATMAGSASLLLIGAGLTLPTGMAELARLVLGITLALDLMILLFGEVGMSHATDVAARAAHEMTRGRYAQLFWIGAIVLGHLGPLALLFVDPGIAAVAGIFTIGGLYAYEHAFVMAPQRVPNS